MKYAILAGATLLGAAACAPTYNSGPQAPDGSITLSEGACFGTCPIYSMTVNADDSYSLNAQQFTVNPGISAGTLPPGSFAAALAALDSVNFATLPTDITPGNPALCGQQVTDLPPATVTRTSTALTRTVDYYPGCLGAPNKAGIDQMLVGLRDALDYTTLVAP